MEANLAPSTTVGWAIIGTGEVSRFIAPDFALIPLARLESVASRSRDRASEFAQEFGFRKSGSFDEVLADAGVDAVYIATPHGTHHDYALRAIAAGKHVLIEKPMATNTQEAKSIATAANAARRFAMEAMWMKFTPGYQALLREVRIGSIGEPQSLRAAFGMAFPRESGSRWSAELGGSTLLDQGIYGVTLALELFGSRPAEVHARGLILGGVDLHEHFALEFANGKYAQLAASMTDFIDPSASIGGTEGWLNVPWPFWSGGPYEIHEGQNPETYFAPRVVESNREGNGFVPMLRAANQSILSGELENSNHPMKATIETFAVLDRIRAALRRNGESRDIQNG